MESICKMGISAGARKGQALPLVGMGEMRQQKQGVKREWEEEMTK